MLLFIHCALSGLTRCPEGLHCFSFADTPGYTALLKQFVGVLRMTRLVLVSAILCRVIRRMPRHHRMVMPCSSLRLNAKAVSARRAAVSAQRAPWINKTITQ